MAERKNESEKDIFLYNFLKENKDYFNKWNVKKLKNKKIQSILDKTSKRKTGNRGEPDLIYLNENEKLLILIENKDTIQQHQSKDGNKSEHYAIDGIKHYLSFFTSSSIKKLPKTTQLYLKDWKFLDLK